MKDFFEEVLDKFLKVVLIIMIVVSLFFTFFCVVELAIVFKIISLIVCIFVDCVIFTILGRMDW